MFSSFGVQVPGRIVRILERYMHENAKPCFHDGEGVHGM